MAKRSGQKSSRSERKAGKQRAQRAREHGLPERREPAVSSRGERVRAATPAPGSHRDGDDRSSDAPLAPARKQLIPTPVKLLGIAVVILIGVYVLSQKRDAALTETKPLPEAPSALASSNAPSPTSESAPVAATASAAAAEVATAPPVVAAAPAASANEAPAVVEPSKPVVAMPSVAAPSKPKVIRPVAPVVATTPAAAPPAAAAAPAAPAPAAPAPAAPAKPADNPY